MSEEPHKREERGVSYSGNLPLAWRSRTDSAEASSSSLASDRNERLLRALLLFQESHREGGEEGAERSADLLRVEAKLDLLFDLVCQLLSDDAQGVEACAVNLGMDGVSWTTGSENPPRTGESLWLSLFLDPDIPQALRLPVRVTGLQRDASGCRIEAVIETLEGSLDDLWGRFIFTQHRRMIARRKARQRSEAAR